MAMGRFNRPSIMVYGGTIRAGCAAMQDNKPIDIVSAFQVYGEYITKQIDEKTRFDVIRHACPGAGACGGMYTANTMASAAEAMGMTLPGSSSIPAEDPAKLEECFAAGVAIRNLLEKDIKPRDIMTEAAFKNAITLTMALGGSTNAVLHLIAVAHSVGIKLSIDDFQEISDHVPYIADLKPSGKYVFEDLHKIGGTQAVLKYLLSKGMIDGSTLTVTGKTLGENLEDAPDLAKGQDIIRPLEKPIKPTGHITILRGSLAPGGSVGKITGKEGTEFSGVAKVDLTESVCLH
jgi:dihydroxy-acid dehydratase